MPGQPDRDQLVAAATELFNERGVQAVGMDLIRDSAGVSLKRLYREFPSKSDLVAAVLKQRDRDVRRGMAEFVDARAERPTDRILAVFDYLAAWFTQPDFRGCMFINSVGELGGTSKDVQRIARGNKSALRAYFAEQVAAEGLSDELADQLALLANGAMVTAGIQGGGARPARSARAAAEALLTAAHAG